MMKKLTQWMLTSLLVALTAGSLNAQSVTPADTFQVAQRGDSVTSTALVISVDGGRDLAKRLDSLEASLRASNKTIALKDSLINNLERQIELCSRSRAEKDTLLRYTNSVKAAQQEVIEALRQNQSSWFDKFVGHTQSFTVGFGTCAVVDGLTN